MILVRFVMWRRRAFSWPRAKHGVVGRVPSLCHMWFDGIKEGAMSRTALDDACVACEQRPAGPALDQTRRINMRWRLFR